MYTGIEIILREKKHIKINFQQKQACSPPSPPHPLFRREASTFSKARWFDVSNIFFSKKTLVMYDYVLISCLLDVWQSPFHLRRTSHLNIKTGLHVWEKDVPASDKNIPVMIIISFVKRFKIKRGTKDVIYYYISSDI